MALTVTHATVASGTDAGNGEIRKAQWNEAHAFSGTLDVANGGTGVATLTGLVKGNGTSAFSAAVAGTDYLAPAAIGTTVQAYDADLDAIAALAGTSGLLKKTAANTWTLDTSTYLTSLGIGSLTQAWDADLDAIAAISSNGILKRTGAGTWAIAASGTDYAPATSGTAILKGNGSGGFSSASAGTDYLAPAAIGSSVQAWDGDLDAIAALSGTSGLLKKTAANTWTLDTSAYLTSGSPATKSADFTFSSNEANITTIVDSASAVVCTIPANSNVAFALGTKLRVFRKNTGTVKISPDTGVTLRLPTGIAPKRLMGAMVRKSADQTAANYVGGVTGVAYDQEAYDTDGFHDNVTNNSRLTIPSGLGIKKVRIGARFEISALTAGLWVATAIPKNGSFSYDGISGIFNQVSNTGTTNQSVSAPLSVADGDYFQTWMQIQTDTSVTVVAATSWFSVEVTEIDAQGWVAFQYGSVEVQKVGTDEWVVIDQSALG